MSTHISGPLTVEIIGGIKEQREVVAGVVIQALDTAGFPNLGKVQLNSAEDLDKINTISEKYKLLTADLEKLDSPNQLLEDDADIDFSDCTIEISVGFDFEPTPEENFETEEQ